MTADRNVPDLPEGRKDIMQIRKCRETEIVEVGAFYDEIVWWLDNHINYPKWMYKIYPSESFVRESTMAEEQYVCMEGRKLAGAFVLNDDP